MSTRHHRGSLLPTYLGPQWRSVLLLLLLLFTSIGSELASPVLLRSFIDRALSTDPIAWLILIALTYLGLSLLTQVASVIATAIAARVSWTATNHLRTDLLAHCLRLDAPFFAEHAPGELVERVDGDVTKLGNFFSQFTVQLLGNSLLLIGILVVSTLVDWRIGLTLLLCMFVSGAIIFALRRVGVGPWERVSRTSADLIAFIEERLAGTEDLRASGATNYALRGLAERWRTYLGARQRAAIVGSIPFTAVLVLMTTSSAVALGVAIVLFMHGVLTVGSVYLVFAYAELLRRPIEEVSRQLQDLQTALASITRTEDLLRYSSVLQDGPGVDLPLRAPAIVFDDVSFRYHPDTQTLRSIAFTVPAGTTLGLLGRTGSGKTTLSRLLFRLYDTESGTITLDGLDIRAFSLRDLRRRIGLVTQDVHLFHGSVRDNLTFFDEDVPADRIITILKKIGLGEWYAALPNGLDTLLAPDGSGLSAGEAQLLAFARIYLQDPSIIILDEASSRLDPATERIIQHAIADLLHGRTAIIIAHRLQTIQQVDRILILEDGAIREFGERDQLARDVTSRYAQLLRVGMEEVLR